MAGEEASQLLSSCERSAVHLEMRDGYSRTDPMFADWRQGKRHDPADWDAWWRPWTDIVIAARSRGVIIRRARIVSEPVSEYIRWEHEITSANVEAGEDVRWLPRRRRRVKKIPRSRTAAAIHAGTQAFAFWIHIAYTGRFCGHRAALLYDGTAILGRSLVHRGPVPFRPPALKRARHSGYRVYQL